MLFALALIVLHTVDGRDIVVNPRQITSMREAKPEGASDKAFTDNVHCMISLTDGKFVTVVESCEHVRDLTHNIEQPP